MPPGCQTRRAIGSGKPLWKLPHRWKKAIRYAAFYHRCLEKWENDFSTATTAATAAQFKNRTSHTFWRRPLIVVAPAAEVGQRIESDHGVGLGADAVLLESRRPGTSITARDVTIARLVGGHRRHRPPLQNFERTGTEASVPIAWTAAMGDRRLRPRSFRSPAALSTGTRAET